jgi:hypothetical protein
MEVGGSSLQAVEPHVGGGVAQVAAALRRRKENTLLFIRYFGFLI